MLVLSRKAKQKIIIGTGPSAIVLTLIDIDGKRVKLGFEAPKEVKIVRSEVKAA